MSFGINTGNLLTGILGNMKGVGGLGGKANFNVASLTSMLASITGQGQTQKFQNYFYRYRVQTFQLLLEGEAEPINILSTAVNKIIITRMYDEAIHPIMEIFTMLPPRLHQIMKDNKQTAKIHFRIKKVQYSRTTGEQVADQDYINSTFSIIIDDETDFKNEDEYKKSNKLQSGGDGKYVFNAADYSTEYCISLWDKTKLDAMCKVVNTNIENATVSTAIKKIYGESGIDKILISPLDNGKTYSEIRIKPMNLMNVPAYIEKIYGTYYAGTTIFLDYRCLYFLSKAGVCNAKEQGEYTRTIIKVPKPGNEKKNSKGITKDTTNRFYYLYVDGESIDFAAPSNTNDVIEGNNFEIVDPSNNETVGVEGAGNQSGKGNARVVEDNYSNEYNKSTMISDVIEKSNVATVTCTDYDEEAFTPNKEFVIIFDDKKLSNRNGFYRLTESTVILSKSNSNLDITGKHVLAFKSAISVGDSEKDEKPTATNKKTMDTKSTNNKQTDIDNASGQKFTPSGPKPKIPAVDNNQVNVTGQVTAQEAKKDPNYSYDELGNLKGYDVPEYNKINESDSLTVKNAKIAAQQKMLPCAGPKPKYRE